MHFLVSEHGFEPRRLTSTFQENLRGTAAIIAPKRVQPQISCFASGTPKLINSHLQWLSDPDSHPAGNLNGNFRIHGSGLSMLARSR